jgi:hypothetical protein
LTLNQTRRRILAGMALTLPAALPVRRAAASEPPPETTTVRLAKEPVICFAPQYVCEQLLRAEGFTDVRYVDVPIPAISMELGRGTIDCRSSTSSASTRARRLRSSPACMAAVTSCLFMAPFAPSLT